MQKEGKHSPLFLWQTAFFLNQQNQSKLSNIYCKSEIQKRKGLFDDRQL